MRYHITFTPDARKQLADLPRKIQGQIARKIDSLADNPRPVHSKHLTGADHLHRIRSGDYRVVYQIEDVVVTVLIVRIANRREVYRNLPARALVRRPPASGRTSHDPHRHHPHQ